MFQPDVTLLAGKVLKRTLEVKEPGNSPAELRLKRLRLPQGELAQIYDNEEGLRYLAFLELREGQVRGNHYHKLKQELLYVIEGEVVLLMQDLDSRERDTVILRAGDLAFIPPGIAHALRPLQSGRAIEGSPTRFDPTDVYRYVLETC